jgi:DNA-binding GntR family transcriptional regulator
MLRDKAYARFKQRLFDGDLKPGQFVSQRELCQVVDMKIGPVRDALKRLQAEALVKVIPQRGIQIADVNVQLLRDAFELRATLELHAVRRYAERGDVAALDALEDKMRSIATRARRRFTAELGREFIRADLAMHQALIHDLGNALIAETYRVNADRILLMQLTNRLDADRLISAIGEHMLVIAALRRRDADAAAAALDAHLKAAQRKMMGVA